jgi:hypothetical protein
MADTLTWSSYTFKDFTLNEHEAAGEHILADATNFHLLAQQKWKTMRQAV